MQDLSWGALCALLLAMFAISVGYGVILPILPFVVERLGSTNDPVFLSRHTGLLTATYILAIFLFAPLWGKASDRWGRRPAILLGLSGFAVTVVMSAKVESLPLLYAARFLAGLFGSSIAPSAYALVGDHAPSQEWRAHRFALINVAGTAGFFVGPLLGGFAVRVAREVFGQTAEGSFSTPLQAVSMLAVAAALAVWGLAPSAATRWKSGAGAEIRAEQAPKLRLWTIAFVTAAAVGAFEVGLSLRGKQVLGMGPSQIGMMFAECSLVMFLVQALVFSPLVKPRTTRLLLTPGLAILAASLIVVALTSTFAAMTAAVALVAASAGMLSPIATYWVSLAASKTQGRDLGWASAAASLGGAIGSAAGGLLADIPILPNAALILSALVVFAGFIASVGLPKVLLRISRDVESGRNVGKQTGVAL